MTPEWKKLREWVKDRNEDTMADYSRLLAKMDEIEAKGKQSQETNETIIPRNS